MKMKLQKLYQEEELLPENPQIVSFFFELTPSEPSGKNPWMDANEKMQRKRWKWMDGNLKDGNEKMQMNGCKWKDTNDTNDEEEHFNDDLIQIKM